MAASGRWRGRARALALFGLLGLLGAASAQSAASDRQVQQANNKGNCGGLGQPCCCDVADLGRNDCCTARDHSCFKFDLGPGPAMGMCMPHDAPQGCGQEGGPCCVASRANRFEITCGEGLRCVAPEDFYYRSTAQHAKLAANFGGAYHDPKVMGVCKRNVECNKAFSPCGMNECPGTDINCPSGFYCANYADATVGDRCLPLPEDAGKSGGRCLPNNFPDAPINTMPGAQNARAPPYCLGADDVCFTFTGPPVLRSRSFLNVFDPSNVKKTASRIWGTKCITVPKVCGGVGQVCCPGASDAVTTDKPLPSYGKAWAGRPCDDTQTQEGAFCNGQWTALGGPLSGTCVANTAGCNDVGNKCCIRTTADKAERYCQAGPNGKRAYCLFTDNVCTECPKEANTLLDLFICT
ncbi:hypothetical protein Rsub_08989 [Raphidocelis subcapitata]|uniref:Uncharacterized protein n=1 Tax=Raphidocelis subcapitata TaxID=307507 RepID=A0A2V0PDY7_9CHLO|nr:hypothetical protein Rsub_08989 [Raphidocelis subcapitata]|eukprot:GBF96113.1 hypothetical protein Rsub_08989 [Raphidocelis subcapitata]